MHNGPSIVTTDITTIYHAQTNANDMHNVQCGLS